MKKEKKIPFKNKFAKGTVWAANQNFDIEVTRMIKSFRDKKGVMHSGEEIDFIYHVEKGTIIEPISKLQYHIVMEIKTDDLKPGKTQYNFNTHEQIYTIRLDFNKDLENKLDMVQDKKDDTHCYHLKIDGKYIEQITDGKLIVSGNLRDAKIYKKSNFAKSSLLTISGYYNDFAYIPQWLHFNNPIDLNHTFELVEIDLKTKKETITDITKWVKTTFNNKVFVKKYGDSITNILHNMENGVEYSSLVCFTSKSTVDYHPDLDGDDLDSVKDALTHVVENREDYDVSGSKRSIIVAIKNENDAGMIRLAYKGNLSLEFLDINEIKSHIKNNIW